MGDETQDRDPSLPDGRQISKAKQRFPGQGEHCTSACVCTYESV